MGDDVGVSMEEGRAIRLPLAEPLLRVPVAAIFDLVSNRSEVKKQQPDDTDNRLNA